MSGWRNWTWLQGVPFLDRWRTPTGPTCEQVRAVLQQFLDGELGAKDEPWVRSHLAECGRCGIEEQVFKEVKRRLARLRPQADEAALARLRDSAEAMLGREQP